MYIVTVCYELYGYFSRQYETNGITFECETNGITFECKDLEEVNKTVSQFLEKGLSVGIEIKRGE